MGAKGQFQRIMAQYVSQSVQEPPNWHLEIATSDGNHPDQFRTPQAHPTMKGHDPEWDKDLEAKGPVGLFISAILWNGLKID